MFGEYKNRTSLADMLLAYLLFFLLIFLCIWCYRLMSNEKLIAQADREKYNLVSSASARKEKMEKLFGMKKMMS